MGTRTPLFGRHTPGGTFNIVNIDQHPADVWFVDSGATGAGDTVGHGTSPDSPFATLGYAFSSDLVGSGDVVYCLPGHAEDIASATGCVMDIAGVTVIGLGRGSSRATLTIDTADTALISVTAANVRIIGLRVVSNFLDIASAISVGASADGFELWDSEIVDTSAVLNSLIGVLIAAACDRLRIEGNRFFQFAASAAASAIKLAGATDRSIIRNNYIMGDYSVAGIDGSTAAGTMLMVDGNVCQNIDTTAGLTIKLHTSTTGAVVRNLTQGAKTNTRPVNAAGCLVAENYSAAVVNESGAIDPTVETFA
jgi:hypothetical protein